LPNRLRNFLKKHLYRAVARIPLLFYRCGLSRLLGPRLLRLHHRGRRTGQMHEVMLEVIDHDENMSHLIVASGWGQRAQWYRNLLEYPEGEVDYRGRRLSIYAVPVQRGHGEKILQRYQQTHPRLTLCLKSLLGEGAWRQVRLLRLQIVT